jgi:hypothetical protein
VRAAQKRACEILLEELFVEWRRVIVVEINFVFCRVRAAFNRA